jgi:uncharacterized protein
MIVLNIEQINQRFRRAVEKILQYRWLLTFVLIFLTIISLVGLKKVTLNAAWDQWFADDDPLIVAKHRFEEVFGNSDTASILVQANDVFSHDVLAMIRNLSEELEMQVPFADKVVSLTEFEFSQGTKDGITIGNLIPDVIPRGKEELEEIRKKAFSKQDLVGKLFSKDSTETWIQLRLKEIPEEFKEEQKKKGLEPLFIIGQAIHKVMHQEKYKQYDLKEAGMPSIAYDKKNFFLKESGQMILLAIVATILVLVLLLHSVRGVFIPVITTFSAILISYGAMGFLGIQIDASMMTVPVYLALAVSIGYSVHILNFFKRYFRKTGKRREAVLYAIEHTGWPLFFTALTTIGCMLAFNFADITTIRWVGNASAAMVTVVYVFVMVLTPVLLSFGKDRKITIKEKDINETDITTKSDRFFEMLGSWVMSHSVIIALIFFIIVVVLGIGIKNVYADFNPFKSFGLKVPYVKRLYDISKSKIGTMYSYDLIIELPENGQAKDPRILKSFESLESDIAQLPLTKKSMSILDVIKDMNRTMHGDDESFYHIPDSRELVSQLLLLYENSGGRDAEYWMDYDYKILRLQVGITDFRTAEVERELNLIGTLVNEKFPKAKFGMVGTLVEGSVVNNYIARGQIKTFFVALLVIGLLMIIVFRSLKAGLIGLVPNLVPVVIIGGVMGYFDIPLDMMSMTIVPMIMGIAVDDSIHFVNHMKLEIDRENSYDKAIYITFKTVGKALLLTSLILVVTFGMYITSVVVFYRVLGLLVGLGLGSALLADYMLTPILMKWTKPFRINNENSAQSDSLFIAEENSQGEEMDVT